MADRFYLNCPLAVGPLLIDGPEAHHLATVCRFRPGDPVCLFNGDGREYPARVVAVARREVAVEVLAVAEPEREPAVRIEVAAPLPKGDRAPFLLEKLTELGVNSFVPLRTRRTVVHPGEAKLEKLQRTVIEASKQCGRNRLLQVQPLTDWRDYCARPDLPALRILAHPGAADVSWTGAAAVALAVGPEGGFTEDETAQAAAQGWQMVSLGPRILRVETAALVLASGAVYALPQQAGACARVPRP